MLKVAIVMLLAACGGSPPPQPAPLAPKPEPAPELPVAAPTPAAEPAEPADPDDLVVKPTDTPEQAEMKRQINKTRRERDRLERGMQGSGSTP